MSAATEFRRGHFIEWRHLVYFLFGERAGEQFVLRARNDTKLSVPPAGPLSDDGQGYLGWDSGCDMRYIGKLE